MPKTKEKVKRKYTKRIVVVESNLVDSIKNGSAEPVLDILSKTQTDGKDWESPKARPRTLAELWGFRGDKFGTLDEEQYKKSLSLMNKADLQRHCIEHGLMPHDTRQTMVDRLLKIFRQHVAAANTNNVYPIPIPKPSEELRRVLNNLGGNNVL